MSPALTDAEIYLITKTRLLDQGLRKANPSGVADLHDSSPHFITSRCNYIIITRGEIGNLLFLIFVEDIKVISCGCAITVAGRVTTASKDQILPLPSAGPTPH